VQIVYRQVMGMAVLLGNLTHFTMKAQVVPPGPFVLKENMNPVNQLPNRTQCAPPGPFVLRRLLLRAWHPAQMQTECVSGALHVVAVFIIPHNKDKFLTFSTGRIAKYLKARMTK